VYTTVYRWAISSKLLQSSTFNSLLRIQLLWAPDSVTVNILFSWQLSFLAHLILIVIGLIILVVTLIGLLATFNLCLVIEIPPRLCLFLQLFRLRLSLTFFMLLRAFLMLSAAFLRLVIDILSLFRVFPQGFLVTCNPLPYQYRRLEMIA
jgi:hypothetical protein